MSGANGTVMRCDADHAGAAATRPTVVVGLGATGLSCLRFLARSGVPLVAMDSRDDPPALAALADAGIDAEVHLGGFDEALLRAAATVVLSPGVSPATPAVAAAREAGVPVIGDIELFARVVDAPVVGITGSNGKSTVTSLAAAMAARAGVDARAGGNLAPPALDLLDPPGAELYFLELSSFQLETTESLRPAVAALLNLSPDHLDRYPDFASYRAAKARILDGAGAVVLNRDDPEVRALADAARPTIWFTLGEPRDGEFGLRDSDGVPWLAHGGEPLVPAASVPLAGRHNLANALAALAVGFAIGLDLEAMCAALPDFPGLPHRCRLVAERDGVRWFNDSKGTNVGATLAALAGIGERGRVVLIAGGDGKGADFSPLAAGLARHARAVVLFGRDAPRIEAAVAGATALTRARDLDDAVVQARVLARRGDAVLFSPACASFDMFRNYEERGQAFEEAVRAELDT